MNKGAPLGETKWTVWF